MTKKSSLVSILPLALLVLVTSPAVLAQATSTPEERAHWVDITHKLESNPLDGALNKEAEKALKRLIEVHDVHVAICGAVFSDLNTAKNKYSGQITRQYMLASGAFVIENPDRATDAAATNLSAVQSVLKVYAAILQQKPDAKLKALDDLLKQQNDGTLESAVRKKCS
jgi:PBP1b-binding outer membrane lipoprotein LpoB